MDREFSRRWQELFIEQGTARDDDAGIGVWTRNSLASRLRQFRHYWRCAAPAGRLWLDLGCGAGSYCRLLHEEGREVVGLDYSFPSLRKARERSASGIAWVLGEGRALPFGDDVFDGALCFGLTQTVEASGPVMAEMRRVVRPGGEVWIDGINARCLVNRLRERHRKRIGRAPFLRYEEPATFRAVAERAGLAYRGWHWLPLAPEGWDWLQGPLDSGAMATLLRRAPWLGRAVSYSFILRAQVL